MELAANTNPYAVLTPYLVPAGNRRKRVNVGDGIILRGIERLIGNFHPANTFTSREAPDEHEVEVLRKSPGIILAGANQLTPNFRILPGLDAATIENAGYRFIPFGVGYDGVLGREMHLTDETKAILRLMHERIAFSSWRCPRTLRILERELPDLKGRMLMTGCPASYDRPLLDGEAFGESTATIAVTVTDRSGFWQRETRVLEEVARLFPRARKLVVFHQDFPVATGMAAILGRIPMLGRYSSAERTRLREFAFGLGYELHVPATVDACTALYDEVDLHVGSRLHAHLYFLSQAKRSFLLAVDGRAHGFAEYLDFPLIEAGTLNRHMDFDFERVRQAARFHYPVMKSFVESI